jgi:hypothetical protein
VIYDTSQGIKEKISGLKDKFSKEGDELKDSVVDSKHRATRKVSDVKDKIEDTVEDVKEKGKEKAKDMYEGARRTFEGASEKLGPLYEKGWEKLNLLMKHGEFKWDEWKDFLGSKFDEVNEMMKPGRDMKKEGKKFIDDKSDKLREFYDLFWNKIDDVFKSGHITFEDLRSVFEDKSDDLSKMVKKFADKNLDKDTTDKIADEIERIKGLIVGWKDKLCENCEHKKNLWENFIGLFKDLGMKASNKWSDLKERVSSTKEEPQPPQPSMDKSSEL